MSVGTPMEIGFSLGSNKGDRLEHLSEAKKRLLSFPDAALVAQSPVYETDPVDVADEYRHMLFLNSILLIESSCTLETWKSRAGAIENDMGRHRIEDRNAPRPIDIDILYAGSDMRSGHDLIIPHPRWSERTFVAKPLADVRPNLILPGTDKTVAQVLSALPQGGVRFFSSAW